MGMNSLENLLNAVSDQGDEINVDNEIVKSPDFLIAWSTLNKLKLKKA